MELLIGYIIGFIVGFLFKKVLAWRIPSGNLRIDCSESESKPYIFLELEKSPDSLKDEKYIVLRVKNADYISHK